MEEKPVIAICGKGGAGKTMLTALLSRVLLERRIKPLLLIDADPACGLISAIGESIKSTLGSVRAEVIAAARSANEDEKQRLVDQLDYLVMQALAERADYSLLAMGHSKEKGKCYCPVNTLLREAIDLVTTPFAAVLIDAEAGLEQISRQVIRRVSRVIIVVDGSRRSMETLKLIRGLVDTQPVFTVANRVTETKSFSLPEGVALIGIVPEDEILRRFDREGRSLWALPGDNAALHAVEKIAEAMGFTQQ